MEAAPTPDVDWQYIEEELRDVPEEFKEQRFYPLKHVVEIFSSGDPQGRTADLREREARLGELVDMVVEGYHPGFARSIQNYSQILQLFQNSREQVESMRNSLNESIRQLGAQSKYLNEQWRRNEALQASLALLKDVQAVVEIPARIDAAVNQKDWPSAVSQLLEGASRLARDELMQIGALRKLRGDMYSLCRYIQGQMCEELQARVYSHAQASTSRPIAVSSSAAARASGLRTAGSSAYHARRRSMAKGAPVRRIGGRQSVDGAEVNGQVVVSTRQLVTCLSQLDGMDEAKAYLSYTARHEVRRLVFNAVQQAATAASQSYHAVVASMEGGGGISLTVPQHVEYLAQQVVGRVAEACLEVLSNMCSVITEVADAPASQTSAALELIRAQADVGIAGGAGSSPSKPPPKRRDKGQHKDRAGYIKSEFMHVWMQMQEEWHLLLSQLLGTSLRALGVRSAAVIKRQQEPAAGGLLGKPLGWLMKFDEFAEQVSSQVEAVLSGQLPGTKPEGDGGGPGSAGPGGVGPVGTATAGKPAASRFHFQLDVKVRDLAPENLGITAHASEDPDASAGYAKLVSRSIGDRQGSLYLTPAIYLRLTIFVEAALRTMKEAGVDVGEAGAKSKDRERDAAAHWLHECVQDLVLEVFLPQVWMDLRARLTAALEQQDAFKAPGVGLISRAAGGGPVMTAVGGPRGVVPVARFADRMLRDMAAWSQAIPTFESSFMGVAENILARMLDAFCGTILNVVGDCKAFQLAMRPDVAHVQACGPDAAFLGEPAAFVVPKGSIGGDVDVLPFMVELRTQERPQLVSVHAGRQGIVNVVGGAGKGVIRGFASEGEAAELEMQLLLYRERPNNPAALMAGANGVSVRHVALAALCESLEYVAESIISAVHKDHGSKRGNAMGARGRKARNDRGALQREVGISRHGQTLAQRMADLPDSLAALVYRCKALAGLCLRTLRMELQLVVAYSLHGLALTSHLVEPGDEGHEVHPAVTGLTRVLTRIGEDLLPHLSYARASYVLGGVANSAARMARWLLADIREINQLGVDRMVRTLSVLQPTLMDLAPALARVTEGTPEAELRLARMKQYDRARAYYQLLQGPCDEVVRLAAEHPMRYTYDAWMALLQVHVPGRMVLDSQLAALQGVLDRAHGLTAGQKIVGAMGTVMNTVLMNPAEKVADVALDVLKAGADTLVAGARIPARQIGKVFKKLGEVAADVKDRAGKR